MTRYGAAGSGVPNGFREPERARRLLYTGLSRARMLLVVTGPRGEIERIGGAGVVQRLHDAEVWSPGGPDR